MGKLPSTNKRKLAFRLRLQKKTIKQITKELSVAPKTVLNWENGWIDSTGRSHKGWKEEIQNLWIEEEKKELEGGVMIKKERLKAYNDIAKLAIEKIKKDFPNVTAKTPADIKALLSEVRELGRLIAIENGEYPVGGSQTLVAIKNDISLTDLKGRFENAQDNSKENAD